MSKTKHGKGSAGTPRLFLSGCLVMFLCGACATGPTVLLPWKTADLYGMVYDHEGQPVPGANVFIDGENAASTDSGGRFVARDLARGIHVFRFEKPGMETCEAETAFEERSDVMHVRMYSARQLVEQALAAWETGQQDDAARWAERAWLADGRRTDTRYLYALLLIRQGDFSQARRLLNSLRGSGLRQDWIDRLETSLREKAGT